MTGWRKDVHPTPSATDNSIRKIKRLFLLTQVNTFITDPWGNSPGVLVFRMTGRMVGASSHIGSGRKDAVRGQKLGTLGSLETRGLSSLFTIPRLGRFPVIASLASGKWFFHLGSDSIQRAPCGNGVGWNTTLIARYCSATLTGAIWSSSVGSCKVDLWMGLIEHVGGSIWVNIMLLSKKILAVAVGSGEEVRQLRLKMQVR